MRLFIAALASASLLLAACSSQTDQCTDAENPAECRQWTQAGGDVNDYLLYGMIGYAIGSMGSGSDRTTYIYRDPGYSGTYPRTRGTYARTQDQARVQARQRVQARATPKPKPKASPATTNRRPPIKTRGFGGRGGRRR